MGLVNPSWSTLKMRHGYIAVLSITEGQSSVTLTIPGPGLADDDYAVLVEANWLTNGTYSVTRASTSVVIGFSTPAPASAELRVVVLR